MDSESISSGQSGPGKSSVDLATMFFLGNTSGQAAGSEWFCEPCLWTSWETVGQLATKTPARLTRLESAKFATAVCAIPSAKISACLYARFACTFVREHGFACTDRGFRPSFD